MNDSCDAVLGELDRIGDVSRYIELREFMARVDVSIDLAFQHEYRAYWKMNVARLGDAFYSEYFSRLESLKTDGIEDIDDAIREIALLSDTTERPSLQFSFATKLLNTSDPRVPVYDTFVSMFYFFSPPASDQPVDTRLEALLAFYAFLRDEYARIIANGLLDPAIRRFRERFDEQATLCDERVIDLLLWSFASLMRSGAQRRGILLYG
ncbi:MAG: hypothetical protein ABJF01_21240 [bacterium]